VPEYDFTQDWFSHNIANWTTLLERFGPVRRVLEIGAFEGRSATWLVEHAFAPGTDGEIVCIDHWDFSTLPEPDRFEGVEDRFDSNLAIALDRAEARVSLRKMKASSQRALAKLTEEGRQGAFDLVFVDGGHTAPATLTDLVMSFALAAPGGLIIVDDYLWKGADWGAKDILDEPKIAVDAFTTCFSKHLEVIQGTTLYQLYLTKLSDP